MTNKSYLVLQLDTEGEVETLPLNTFPTKEQALEYIHYKVALKNLYNLRKYMDVPDRAHVFNPVYMKSFEIEEL